MALSLTEGSIGTTDGSLNDIFLNLDNRIETLENSISNLTVPTEIGIALNTSNIIDTGYTHCYKIGKFVVLSIVCRINNTSNNFDIASGLPSPIFQTHFVGINVTQAKPIRFLITNDILSLAYNATGFAIGDELNIYCVYIAND